MHPVTMHLVRDAWLENGDYNGYRKNEVTIIIFLTQASFYASNTLQLKKN